MPAVGIARFNSIQLYLEKLFKQHFSMRRIILFNMVTADGFFEGESNDISWHHVDEEVNDFFIEQMKTADTILFGRKTFEVMENFWPTEKASEEDPVVAAIMSNYLKIVFSKTRSRSDWNNTKFAGDNAVEEIKKLKSQAGKDIIILGSSDLSKILVEHNLVDEFRLMINPTVLGSGRKFFYTKMNWQLLKTKVFGNGNVLLCYRNAG